MHNRPVAARLQKPASQHLVGTQAVIALMVAVTFHLPTTVTTRCYQLIILESLFQMLVLTMPAANPIVVTATIKGLRAAFHLSKGFIRSN